MRYFVLKYQFKSVLINATSMGFKQIKTECMKIAVIKTGGKQYKVSQGQIIKIEKISSAVGTMVKFDTLMIANDDRLDLGKPSLGEKVEGKILEQGRSKKIHVIKYKSKTRYRRNVGHRQPFTKVEIVKVGE